MCKGFATYVMFTESACAVIFIQTVPFIYIVISPLVIYFPTNWFVSTHINGHALIAVPATLDRIFSKVAGFSSYVTFCSFVTISTVVRAWINYREL